MVAARAIGPPTTSVASSAADTPIVATASAGIAHVRSASAATGAGTEVRELCFAPAEARLREAVAIGTLAGWLLSQRYRGGKRVGRLSSPAPAPRARAGDGGRCVRSPCR